MKYNIIEEDGLGRSKKIREQRKQKEAHFRRRWESVNSHFLPVKITDKEWADRLMDGEVFMNQMKVFQAVDSAKNGGNSFSSIQRMNYRDDPFEGIVSVSKDVQASTIIDVVDEPLRNQIDGVIHIDTSSLPYFRLFCMYRLEYDAFTERFRYPDPRVRQFGDTAVIFLDFNEFLNRLVKAIVDRYGEMFVFMCDKVQYLDLKQIDGINCILSTVKSFSLSAKR